MPCIYASMLKDATAGLIISKLFASCWGVLFQVFRLSYVGLWRVRLGVCIWRCSAQWTALTIGALSLGIVGLSRPIICSRRLWLGYYALCSLFYLDLLVDPLYSAWTMHFRILWLFQELCPSLDRLIGPKLVHRSGHRKGHSKLSLLGFRCGK